MNQMQRLESFTSCYTFQSSVALLTPSLVQVPERTQFRNSGFDQTHLFLFEVLKFLIVEKPSKRLFKVSLLYKLAFAVRPENQFP